MALAYPSGPIPTYGITSDSKTDGSGTAGTADAENGGAGVPAAPRSSPFSRLGDSIGRSYDETRRFYRDFSSKPGFPGLPIIVCYLSILLWTLLATALIGDVIDNNSMGIDVPANIGYCMFVAVLSWIVLALGVVELCLYGRASWLLSQIFLLAHGFAFLCTFIAGAVLAAALGVNDCFNYSYVSDNENFNGLYDPRKGCQELQASAAFFWFLFGSYGVVLFLRLYRY